MRPALAQINPTVGDLPGNAGLLLDAARHAAAEHADLVLFPELAICGYPPKDLILAEGFVDRCVNACADTARDVAQRIDPHLTLLIGSPRRLPDGGIANALLAYRGGRLLAAYDKRLLPTYDVFDEDRYFTPGRTPVVIDVPDRAGRVTRVGLAICEDLWKGLDAGFSSRYTHDPDPVPELVAAGARVIAVASASPFVLGKGRRHRDLLRSHATRHGVDVLSVNQVGGNDDLIFDGHASAYDPQGRLIAAAPGFESAVRAFDLPAAPALSDPSLDTADELQLFRALVLGVRDYCRKTGFRKAILGLSGGIDSAVTAALAAAALEPANLQGVAMPGAYSSEHSVTDAHDLAQRLAMPCATIPITPALEGFRGSIDHAFASLKLDALGQTLPDLAEENLQSRVRGTILMALSNRSGAIVLTTGNKSELAVGYCTLYGDMNGGLAVLSDVTKQWVYRLARFMNAEHRALGFASPPIPPNSIDKPPSAELRPNQTDQDSLPPYDVLDAIIDGYVERKESPASIVRETGFDAAVVRRICRMIDLAEYKRKQAAVGLKVTGVAFGTGRRVPIAQRWNPAT